MPERFLGIENWDAKKLQDAARVFGWTVAVTLIGAGVVLSSGTLVTGGQVVALMDATTEVVLRATWDSFKTLKEDLFGEGSGATRSELPMAA